MMGNKASSRKEQIINTALQIISEEGMQKLTMKNIGQRIGISDAALYKHFDSKNEIVLQMIQAIGKNLTIQINLAVVDIDDPLEKLEAVLRTHLSYLENNKGIPRIIFSDAVHQHNPILRQSVMKIINHYLDLISGILVRARQSGHIRNDLDLRDTALAFLGLVQSTTLIWSPSDFDFSLSEKASSLWHIFSKGLQ